MKRFRKCIGWLLVTAAVLTVLLVWPVAQWLECRECWLGPDRRVDAIYVMAGSHDRDRVRGVVAWLKENGQADRILLPYDPLKGGWSRRDQRNLSMGEWSLRFMTEAIETAGLAIPIEVVSADMGGTDAEVASVAQMMNVRSDLKTMALATSRFHVRRTRQRAEQYFDQPPGVIPGAPTWYDRLPWVTGMELLKMVRDRVGLARVIRRRCGRDGM